MEQTVSKTKSLTLQKVSLAGMIASLYGNCENSKITVSNMLLDKYQIGTKKSEFQKLSQTI